MYRAIPEVSRICSMQERTRQYKLHLEALQKIKKQSPQKRALSAQANLGLKPLRKGTLRGSSKREEQKRITHENQKMYNAILYRPSYINHYDFITHQKDHEYQMARMAQHRGGTYGFEDLTKTKKRHLTYADEFEQNAYSTGKSWDNDENEENADDYEEKEAPEKKETSTSIKKPLQNQVKEDIQEKKEREQQKNEEPKEEPPKDEGGNDLSLKANVDQAFDDAKENREEQAEKQQNADDDEPGKIKGALIDKIEQNE